VLAVVGAAETASRSVLAVVGAAETALRPAFAVVGAAAAWELVLAAVFQA